jgi:Rnl2 family RNA ligase
MFRRYFSIEGTWRKKEIQWWIEKYPHIDELTYILQEKIHGANVSWVFGSDGAFEVGKRTSVLTNEDNFYNFKIMYEEYADVIILLKEYALENECNLNVFGEWFGKGIQKGVDYGPKKQLLFYDVLIDNVLMSPFEMDDLFSLLNISDMMVPNFGTVDSLQEAIDFDTSIKVTKVYPEGKSIIEGVVIKPYYNTMRSENGKTFYLKNKNEVFKEIQKKRKKNKPKVEYPEHVQRIKNAFSEYITENRLNNVFSKHGEIESSNDLGKYIKLFLEDAKEEFTKDYKIDIMDLDKKELKYVYNESKQIVNMLKGRM